VAACALWDARAGNHGRADVSRRTTTVARMVGDMAGVHLSRMGSRQAPCEESLGSLGPERHVQGEGVCGAAQRREGGETCDRETDPSLHPSHDRNIGSARIKLR
jgi:hypothetical protein